jgi:hypothetical protein
MGSEEAGLLNVPYVQYPESLDIGLCLLTPQEQPPPGFAPVSILLDTSVPETGETVHMVSLDKLEIEELAPPSDEKGAGQILRIERRVSIRVGVVTGVFQEGLRQYQWPCFTISIPAKAGMSGGFVYLPRDGGTVAACGLLCADNSSDEAQADFYRQGESVIASLWPAVSLRAPVQIPSTPETPTRSLHEMMKAGTLPIAVGGIDHLELIDLGNGDFEVRERSLTASSPPKEMITKIITKIKESAGCPGRSGAK